MPWCSHCAKNQPTENENLNGFLCCTGCGKVLEEEIYSTEVTFIKTSNGQSQLSGTYIRSAQDDSSESRERTLRKGRDEIHDIVVSLCVSGGESTIDYAHNLYKIAVERNFTRGRSTKQVAAVCVYIVCRQEEKPYLLIDFSDFLQINVYVLGAVFLRLCKLLRLEEHPIVQKPIDPSLFIHRFSIRLLGKDDKESRQVGFTAMRIVASMKRDWMQTGRKPSGLCGAALYISALSYGLKCSKSDVVTVVHICEATLTKRLIEFENTESGSLTIEEFMTKAEELEAEVRQLPLVSKMSEMLEVLCEHKGRAPHFAHGLCKECYRDFLKISGGIQGGSEPPAFQRAERERMAKASLDQKAEEPGSTYGEGETGHSNAGTAMEYSSKKLPKSAENGPIPSSDSETISALSGSEACHGNSRKKGSNYECLNSPSIEKDSHTQSHGDQNMDSNEESETLSDIDDAEVDGYLHDEEETRLKTIIWTEMNKEYLEEQAAKEAAAAAARATYIANLENAGDAPAAFELAAAAAAAVEKLKKDRRQKRAEEAKNATPAQTPAEAARQMLTKKRLSSRINYDVLEKLFEDSEPPETKKAHTDLVNDNNSNVQWKSKKEEDKGFESNVDDNDCQAYGDAYEEEDAGQVYGGHSFYGDQEDYYGYDDGYGSDY